MKQIYLFFASIGIAILALWIPVFVEKDAGYFSSFSINEAKKKQKTTPAIKQKSVNLKQRMGKGVPFLNFDAAPPSTFSATKSFTVQGGGNAVPGGQLNYSVILDNQTGSSVTGVVFNDVLNSNLTLVAGSVKSTPIAGDDSYTSIGNVGITVNAASGLLSNDISPTNVALTATAVATGTSTNGKYSIATDGSFTYTPNAGYTGIDSFTYTLNSGTTSSTGTVNITVSGMIWFVNAGAASSGTGTLASPFKNIANISGTSAGNTIFLYSGTYTGSLILLGTQKLIGEGATASLATITGITVPTFSNALPATGGTNPTWNTAVLTLASGNDVEGINFNSTTGTTMTGASVGALKVRDVSLNNTAGQALQITAGGALDVIFKKISATGATKGISVNSSTGSFQVVGTGTNAGDGGTISTMTNRGAEFISCSSVSLAYMNFTNANNTNDGTIAIGADGNESDNASANGAIFAQTVNGLTLDNIAISGTTKQNGINLKTVTNFVLSNSTVNNCGDGLPSTAGTYGEFEGCLNSVDMQGTCSISNSTLGLASGRTVLLRQLGNSSALTLTISGSTFNGPLASSIGVHTFEISSANSTVNTVGITTSTFTAPKISNLKGFAANNSQLTVNLQTSNLYTGSANNSTSLGGGVHLTADNTSALKFNILGNTLIRAIGTNPMYAAALKSATAEGRINNNTAITSAGNCCSPLYLNVDNTGGTNSSMKVEVKANTFYQTDVNNSDEGIFVRCVKGSGRIDATIIGNIITVPSTNNFGGIYMSNGLGGAGDTFTNATCANIRNNTVTGLTVGFNYAFYLETFKAGQVVSLEKATGVGTDAATIWAANSNSPTTAGLVAQSAMAGSIIGVASGTCAVPSNPAARLAISDANGRKGVTDSLTNDESPKVAIIEEDTIINDDQLLTIEPKNKPVVNSIADIKSIENIQSGETVTVNGTGSGFTIPTGKNTTITFSATISSTPTSCSIQNTASIASNLATFNSNTTTTTLVVPSINAGSTISATSVCTGGSITLGATCPSGSQLNWFTASSGGSSVSTSSPYSPTNITAATSYYASCTIGGCESARTLVGSVTIIPNNTVTLTSAAGTNAQTKCINTPITNITYSTTGATGATFSGLPAGVTGAWASNVVTISGTPTTTTGSPFSYTVTLTGGCGTVTATGTITVSPVNTVSLTSTAGTNAQTVCINTPITNITYATTGATGATFSGLPAGVTGAWASNVVTISGSPTTTTGSPFSYTVTLMGGCGTATATGTITVSPNNTVSLTSAAGTNAQTKCVNTPITNITYSTTGATGATFSGLPAGVTGAWASNVVTISGTPTTATGSPFSYTVTLTGGCGTITATGTITVNSTPAPTSPTATPSSRTTTGPSTLSASGCSGGTLTWYDTSTNVAIPSPNNQPNFTASGTFNFYAKCTGANTCVSDASPNVSVSVVLCTPLSSSPGNVNITWTGLVSTDWNTACNWNPAWVPDATNSAVVIGLQTNQPTITGTVPTVNQIYINSNATLTVNSGGTLNANNTVAPITLQGGNIINDGTINLSGGGTGIGISIQATASVTNRGTITTNNLYGISLEYGNLTFTNESTGIYNGDFKANSNILTLTNRGTINYAGGTFALNLNSGSSVVNTGIISITTGNGISNPSSSSITNNACGKILMTVGEYQNGGTTTNAGLIQMPNTYNFTNQGTFTNNGVVKANTVASITNNKMVITNACPIFTLGGTNNYTVSGIFTDAGALTSAGTYTSVGNKFTANNTIPTGTQTLYAQVSDGTCTFVVPFDFNNVKPTSVSVNNTAICTGTSVTLSATCASGTPTWYTTSTGGSNIGTGASLSQSPTVATTYYVACEATNCVSGRVATSEVTVSNPPFASANSNSPICAGTTLNLNSGSEGNTYLWTGPNSFTSTELSPSIANATISATGTYTITITNASNCTSTATTAVMVNAVPAATASSNSPVCVGNSISLTGGGVGTYLWAGPNSFTSTAQSPTIANAAVSATGTYTITVTGTGSCTSTATTAVTVNGLATASVTPSTQTICSGGAITTIAISGTGTSYTWTRDNTTSATGIAASGSGNISGSLTNTTDASITVTFTITPVSICNGTPITATVVVNPIPTATASTPSQSICSGASITGITFNTPPPVGPSLPNPNSDIVPTAPTSTKGIVLNGPVVGTIFNWIRDNTATVTGIAASGTGNISGNLTNTTASPVTVTFTVTPSYTNAGTTCTGTPITVTVTVNPNPASATITDAGTNFCSGSSTTLSAPANPNYTYAWQRSLTGIANPNSFTAFGGTAQTQVITTSGVYRAMVTNQYNCSVSDTTAVKFGNLVFSGSLAAGDAQQTGRMNRFAVVSTCAAPTSYPGTFTTAGSRFYDSYTVTNPSNVPVCATIGLTSGCGIALFSAAYLGSFNPTSLGTNYLADHGSSFSGTAFYEATIPANGTIVVVVHEVNPGTGCSNYNLRIDVPGATIAPTASSNSPICAGNTLNLVGTGTGTYAWAGPNSFTSSAQNPSIANATTLATGTYTISVTNTNGCVFNATTAVIVNANPTATASSSTPVICAGNSISLTGGGVGTYQWTGPNTFSSTAQSPIIANATTLAAGIYTITVTNSTNCSSTATIAVTVNANPTATASSSTPVICAGNTISLSGGGIGTYAWTGVNGFTSTDQNPSISNASILASGTYKITVTNANGCTSTATTSVTVNANPTATASSSSPICAGTTLSLMGGGVGTYQWTGPNGYSSTAQSPTITNPMVLASGIYKITVTNANSCTSTATISITVNPLPVVNAGANQTICEGSTASLTATCNLLTFNTTLSGTSEVPANASTATGNVSGTYDKVSKQLLLTFTFNGLAANASAAHLHVGAVGTNGAVQIPFSGVPAATSGSFTYTGTLTSTQEADLLAGLYYANIHNASFPGGEIRGQLSTTCVANSFVWNPGNLSGQTVMVSPTSNQLYTVTASNTATGCLSTATTTVNVNPRPVVTIGSNTPVCTGNTLNLNAGGGTTYAWAGPNTFSSTDQNPSIASVTLLASGTYTVTVTNASGCINTATTAVVINALPTATASNNSPICSGATLNLTGSGVGTYAWAGPSGYTSTAQSPSILSATASMSGTYTIAVTNVNGCTSTATTSVTVNPVVTVPTPQANTQIIFGASITLTATGCSGVNDVLKWYKSLDNTLAVMPVSPTATTNYYAKCETTLNGITCISGHSVDVTVTVLQPQPPIATGATICTGGSVTLTATGCSGSTGTFVLKWYLNATDALVTMPVSPSTNTDYYAKCEQTFNSVSAISAKSNVVTVTVLNPLAPVATGGTIYLGNSITLTATGCTGAGFVIKWYQTSDNALVTMPVSPTVTTQYYSKCEQTANSVTCLSAKSNDVTVTVVNRIFVDITKIAAPIQNGNSWATAYGNLQTGLAAAAAVVVSAPAEVWVAQGTYKPTTTTTRTIYFNIPSSVKVYGGFAGTENALNDRNFRTNPTILSGDIGTVNLASDNSYHVVTFDGSSNTTVLDGFTITGGYANFDPKRVVNASVFSPPTTVTIETGGGIVVQNAGSPMITNCTIINNAAVMGGGVYASDASIPKIIACKIISNQATFGAGIYFQNGSNGSINNTLISGNRGIGAVYNNTSNPTITNCTFAGNGGYNGGIFNSASQPVVRNTIIWNNSTPFNDTQSIITYSTIQGGYAGTGNLSFDPKFVNPVPDGLSPTLNGDYHLQASSLAIDRGDNTGISLTDKDLDGNLRRYNGGTVDMGAYEFQGVATSNIVISAQTGDWEINSTWVGFKVPALGDVVIIDANHIVTINATGIAKSIEYRGTGQIKFKTTAAKLNIGF